MQINIINVEDCDLRYSFHYTGSSGRLCVFETPIELLSFLTRCPRDWQEHSCAALCGTSEHAGLWMLEQNPQTFASHQQIYGPLQGGPG